MALGTHSKFYYGFKVEEGADTFDFEDAGGTYSIQLEHGTYTLSGLFAELAQKMNAASTQVYTVTVDRRTRIPTISAPANFKLLPNSGAGQFSTVFPMLGWSTEADMEGANTYSGEFGAGSEYVTQFPLQSYVPTTINEKPVFGSKKRTITGQVEAARYGTEKFMECEMLFVTDIPQPPGSLIRNRPNGVEDLTRFLREAGKFGEVEFMPDENDAESFEVLILESTEYDSSGMGYKLREEYDEGLPGYYSSGKLIWVLRESA